MIRDAITDDHPLFEDDGSDADRQIITASASLRHRLQCLTEAANPLHEGNGTMRIIFCDEEIDGFEIGIRNWMKLDLKHDYLSRIFEA